MDSKISLSDLLLADAAVEGLDALVRFCDEEAGKFLTNVFDESSTTFFDK